MRVIIHASMTSSSTSLYVIIVLWRGSGRGTQRLHREDCVKRELVKVGEEWTTRAKGGRNWRLLMENVVQEKREKVKEKGH